ncbi:MAG: hypothetical protein R3330_09870, partial [Saprospiraceae bacterium]|nr:hypothetical protein [Saprospiraceae bacterium]
HAVDAVQRDIDPSYTCTMPDADQATRVRMREVYAQFYEEGMALKNRRNQATVINVTAHRTMVPFAGVCIATAGGNAPIVAEIEDDINFTNGWFADIGFNVHLNLVSVNDICSEYWYNLPYTSSDSLNWWAIYNAFGVEGHLNIFYTSSGSSATFPAGLPEYDLDKPDNMFVHKNTHAGWGWTVAHEIGHWFGLYHTFQSPKESVTRDPADSCYDCEYLGDELCSTAADYGTDWCDEPADECACTGDYNETFCTNGGGSANGTITDLCGVPYDPDLYNIMAYGCRPCAHTWTGEQVDRQWVYLAARLAQASITHGSCNGNMDAVNPATATTGQRVESSGYIISTQNIETHQYTLYDAATSVDLNPGFTAEWVNGIQPNFEVVNEGCYGIYQLNRPEMPVLRPDVSHPETVLKAGKGQ